MTTASPGFLRLSGLFGRSATCVGCALEPIAAAWTGCLRKKTADQLKKEI
jgi:hypothetical protein